MYEDTYTEYNPANFEYGNYKIYEITKEKPYYEWDYGDTFALKINLGEWPYYKEDYLVYIQIYDFRHNLIYETIPEEVQVDCFGRVIWQINKDISNQFIKGTYQCGV